MNIRRWVFSMVAVCLVVPMLVFAQAADGGLVPCGDKDDTGINSQCQLCHGVDLINNIAAWLVGALSVAAAIMFVIAGYRLVTAGGNPSALKAAKDMIINVAIGFVIVLSAWLIIDLVMKVLVGGSLSGVGGAQFGPWNAIQCVEQPTYEALPDVIVSQGGSIGVAGGTYYGAVAEPCDEVFPGGPQVDCAAQETACRAGGGEPEIDNQTDANMHTIRCKYQSTGYAGSCSQISDTSNPCHSSNLTMFGSRAAEASVICNKESGGQSVRSGSDLCCGPSGNCSGAPSFSGGFFQINVLAHADKIPGCDPGAFYSRNGTAGPQGDCVRRNGEGICTGWSCSITNTAMYNECMKVTTDSSLNFQIAEQLYDARGQKFNDWSWSARRCNISF